MISKLAQVSEMAQIGEDVIVEPFSYIAGDVVIGSGCHIGPGAVILDGARIGKNCKIHTSAVVAGGSSGSEIQRRIHDRRDR